MSRPNTTIYALDKAYIDDLPLRQFEELLAAAISKIPDEYRGAAVVSIVGQFDDDFAGLEIRYERPETDSEFEEGEKYRLAAIREREARERADYERLKAKYG